MPNFMDDLIKESRKLEADDEEVEIIDDDEDLDDDLDDDDDNEDDDLEDDDD